MPDAFSAYIGIAIIAAVTGLTRVAGAIAMQRVALSPRVERFLEAMSIAVLAALAANAAAAGGLREAASLAVAIVVMLVVKRPVVAMFAGMAVAAGWSALAG